MLTYRGQAVSAGDLVEMRTLVVDMIREQHLDKSVISGKQIFKDMLTYWLAAKSAQVKSRNADGLKSEQYRTVSDMTHTQPVSAFEKKYSHDLTSNRKAIGLKSQAQTMIK